MDTIDIHGQSIEIDGVLIPFNKHWKNIAISVSGGADSALLAWLLCKIITEQGANTTVNIISHTRCWKTRPWQQQNSLDVYNYLVESYPSIEFKRFTNFIAPELEYGNIGPTITDEYGKLVSGDNIMQRAFAEYVCVTGSIECYYNAVTCNPKHVFLEGAMQSRDLVQPPVLSHLELMYHLSFLASHPFRFTDKSWVIRQYIKNQIQSLLDITRSCEGEFNSIDYKTYKPGQYVPLCNNCFWCKEREWAINESK
jgi:hypothetical protein